MSMGMISAGSASDPRRKEAAQPPEPSLRDIPSSLAVGSVAGQDGPVSDWPSCGLSPPPGCPG